MIRSLLLLTIAAASSLLIAADDPVPPVDFANDVQPIFASRCAACHGREKQKSGLRLDRKSAAMTGGDSGRAIVPGKSADSPLIQRVLSADEAERMPPSGERLTPKQIAALRAWIDQGAKWPDALANEPAIEHWAFQPIRRPAVPAGPNPIDAFIAAKLDAAKLRQSPEASRATLIRRLKLDLLGLPPSPEEGETFARDESPDAYAKLVERFLASPHYGERWARHWLDVVRFAESNGFETNIARNNAWPYRDYVIQSLNDDKPYDRFILEQLAGDTLGIDAATGFLVAGPWDQVKSPDPVLTSQQRADELHDIASTTGSAFLGLTIGCARCHNHKFDPISQTDYFAVVAAFAGVQHGERTWRRAEDAEREKERVEVRNELNQVNERLVALEPLAAPDGPVGLRLPVNARMNVERFAATTAKYVRFTVLATNSVEPCLDELEVFAVGPKKRNVAQSSAGAAVRSSGNYQDASMFHRLEYVNDGRYGNGRSWISNEIGKGWVEIELKEPVVIDRITWGRDRESKFRDRLATQYRIEVAVAPEEWKVVASSADRMPFDSRPPPSLNPIAEDHQPTLRELWGRQAELNRRASELSKQAQLYAGRFTTPEPIHRLHRGDPMQKRELVAPAALASIGPRMTVPADTTEPQRRAQLARWIGDPKNPLTARVLVNRLWHYHFGTGLVATPSDFGRNGAKPSHPELLDWLASEFMSGGWRLKPIHRLIVTSAAYRQASAANPAGLAADAQSRLLWRYPTRRLEAEAVRDSILFVSGKLDPKMGGPGFDLFEPNDNYVKVYTPKKEFGPAEWRRMIYQAKPRMQLDDTFGAFDCPDGGQIAPRRNVSTTPLQALNLLNGRFLLQQANFLAERVTRESGVEATAQIERAFCLALQREPTASEIAAAKALVDEHGLPALCRALFNANEFVYVE